MQEQFAIQKPQAEVQSLPTMPIQDGTLPEVRRQVLASSISPINPVGLLRLGKQYDPGTVILVPIHDAERRKKTIIETVTTLAYQQNRGRISFVLANNGLSNGEVGPIQSVVESLGVPFAVADARPVHPGQRSPAYARNVGVKLIRELARQNPAFRGDTIGFLDSDTAFTPESLPELLATFTQYNDAVAVMPTVVPVDELDNNTYRLHKAIQDRSVRETVFPLPRLRYPDGSVDVSSIVAFSSDIAGKTTGLIADRDIVFDIDERTGQLFVQMPKSSGEDMMFAVALNEYGRIYSNPNARVLDEARQTRPDTRKQQMAWGYDHVILLNDLKIQSLVDAGLTVMEPVGDHWEEWTIPGTNHITGRVINPAQLRIVARMLEHFVSDPSIFGDSTPKIVDGIVVLNRVLGFIELSRPQAEPVVKEGLPRPTLVDTSHPRFSSVATTARLAGNIMGMYDIQEVNGEIPQAFMFGLRQAARWN